MIRRFNQTALFFTLTLLIFIIAGTQAVYAENHPTDVTNLLGTRVDRCHSAPSQSHPTTCSQPETCHRARPQPKDMGGHEYHNPYHDSHSLHFEPRQHTPQLRFSEPFVANYSVAMRLAQPATINQTTPQSLRSISTTVMLN